MKKYYLHIIVMVGYFLFVAGSCGEEPEIVGCTVSNACNYNIEATIDNGSCEFESDCAGECGGSATEDCAGDCNGSAIENECGVCNGSGPADNFDCDGNCLAQTDDGCECAVLYDECGFCGGDNSSCTDCGGIPNGSSEVDMCGICDLVAENDCVQDCQGNWGGDAINDICDICDGGVQDVSNCIECPNSDPADCIGVCGGEAIEDECGVCGSDNSSCADCAGTPNGDAVIDMCGTCDSDDTNDCVQDCTGGWGGNVALDECRTESNPSGICGGDNSTCTDCNNVINGLSLIDYCGNCIELPASWKIEIMAELILMNPDLDTLVDGSTNYLGANILYTDGFDGFEVDTLEPLTGANPFLSFSFYHDDWEDENWNEQYYYFTQDIRNHNYNDFLNDGKTWNAELKSINNWYNGTAKIKFHFIDGLSDASIVVNVNIVNESGSDLSVTSYSINDGDYIDEIMMNYNYIVKFDIQISNLCY